MTPELSTFAARLRELIHSLSADAAGCDFNALALELFPLQFKHSAAYRTICEARNATPASVSHWTQIPAVPTAAFKEFDLTCLPPGERQFVFHSSGTTGQRPSRHFHNAESLAVYEASLLSWFRSADGSSARIERARLALLTPSPSAAPHSSLVHMFDVIRRARGLTASPFYGRTAADGSWTIDLEGVIQELQTASDRGEPLALFGTAFSFVHLLDQLAEKNLHFKLPSGSRVLETGGYKGRSRSLPKAELHRLISTQLGVPSAEIVCEYGMSELSSQAYGVPAGPFRFPPWTRIQVISPETNLEVAEGATGLLRVFDLANVFSVLAIQTEDLAVRRANGFELIGRATFAEPRGCSLMAS